MTAHLPLTIQTLALYEYVIYWVRRLEKQAAASARLAIRFQRFLHELAPVEYSIPTEQTASEAEISSTKPLIEGTRTNRQPCSLLFVNGRLFPFQAQN